MTATERLLARLLQLVDGSAGMATRPMALLALRDAVEAHNPDGLLDGLRDAVEAFHCASLSRQLGHHDAALSELEHGTHLLRVFVGAQ